MEQIKSAPWMVSLSVPNTGLICGGVIISPYYILTAAYCVFSINPADISIRVGSNYADREGNVFKPQSIIVHNSFNASTKNFNFALLKLVNPLKETLSVAQVKIRNPADHLQVGAKCLISGYGRTDISASGMIASLKSATVNIVDQDNCAKRLFPLTVTNTMICAAGDDEDACAGDAGGPLICAARLVGIISWGRGCLQGDMTGVFADVNSVRQWLTMNGIPV